MNTVPPIISELLEYVSSGRIGPVLSEASFGSQATDRVVCINLLSWWRRKLLMRTSHPYLEVHSEYPWCGRLIDLITANPGFREVMVIDGNTCKFAPHLTREDWQLINELVRDRYHPRLMTKPA